MNKAGEQTVSAARISREELFRLKLHDLYRQYGYARFKMDKFEEYGLYLANREFVETESIIVFNDASGRLLALKPDLTLSIVKNFKPAAGQVSRVFYSENVYRFDREQRTHREMMQTGLECMGDLDLWQTAEVTLLAARSLEAVSDDFVLDISHMGLVTDLLSGIGDEAVQAEIVRCIGEKNVHEMVALCRENGVAAETADALALLITAYGNWDGTKEKLARLPLGEAGKGALAEMDAIFGVLAQEGFGEKVRVDFSIVNDMNYYSGILFQGFLSGVPHSVLAGGQYDKLMARMGKSGGALGFAVYLNYLEQLPETGSGRARDIWLVYGENGDPETIRKAANAYIAEGRSVRIVRTLPEGADAANAVFLGQGGGDNE